VVGFNIGVRGRRAAVICSASEKRVYQAEPGRTEWVTVIECICADGSALPPLVIFKGKSAVQTAWVPSDMDKDWSWACNTKGWTCNAIGEEWVKNVFGPLTEAKANGATRLLVVDGHGSHVTAPFVRYCMDNNIVIVLLPPHSSHITQPLDVCIFSSLKTKVSQALNEILCFGVPNIQKFEWADCYRKARPSAMGKLNIEGAWRGAGLFPFNPQKVIRRFRMGVREEEIDAMTTANCSNKTPSPRSNKYNLVPNTPSNIDPVHLRSANELASKNINTLVGILDTPTRKYIPRALGLLEQIRAAHVVTQHHLNGLNAIVKKRKSITKGKRSLLKGKTVITTNELYQRLKEAEDEAKRKKNSTTRGRGRKASKAAPESSGNVEQVQEENKAVIHDVVERMLD